MRKILTFEYLLAGISGVLMALCFSFSALSCGSFFALVPLFLAVQKALPRKKTFRVVLCYGFFYYITLVLWIYELAPLLDFGKLSVPILTLGLLLIGLFEGGLLALPFLIFPKLRRDPMLDIFSFAALFTIGEWLQGAIPLIPFPWGRLGAALPNFPIFLQGVALFGGLFISFLILSINGAIALAISSIKQPRKIYRILAVLGMIFAVNLGYGAIIFAIDKPLSSASHEVLLVQGNFSGQDKWDSTPAEMLAEYLRLSGGAVTENTRLVVFPETAIPLDLEINPTEKSLLCNFARDRNVTILAGVNHRDGEEIYNSMVAISPKGAISAPYSKQMLVPFGETVPLYRLLSKFTDSFDDYNFFSAGESSAPVDTDIGRVGGIICYESIFPTIARKTVNAGAEILAVISNDSWFGDSPALYQHFAHSSLRAIENGRYLLRASNTAVTAVLSPRGEVLAAAKPFSPTTISATVAISSHRTLYTRYGDAPLLIGIFAYLLIIFLRNFRPHIAPQAPNKRPD